MLLKGCNGDPVTITHVSLALRILLEYTSSLLASFSIISYSSSKVTVSSSTFHSLPHRLMKTCRLQSKRRGVSNDDNCETIGEIYLIVYLSNLVPVTVNSPFADTPLLRTPRYHGHPACLLQTVNKSPAENTMKFISITIGITDSHY